jgi:Phosphoinositide phospholipase C, Ca2+-dependent
MKDTAMANLLARLSTILVFPLCAVAQQTSAAQQDQYLHINQIQVIGGHNSYHTGLAPSERKLIEQQNPKAMRALDYAHPPLADQLSSGVRQLEIDVYADSKGGRYSHPAIVDRVAAAVCLPTRTSIRTMHGLIARCNPATAPPGCVDEFLEPSAAKSASSNDIDPQAIDELRTETHS